MITVTGPSCSGKSYLIDSLIRDYPSVFVKLISDTTRPPRAGEEGHSSEYRFVSEDEFRKNQEAGDYVQSVNFMGVWYGTRLSDLQEFFAAGKCPIRIVEPGGVLQFQEICNALDAELVSVFVQDEPLILMERWLQRFRDDGCTSEDRYALRILNTFNRELKWVEEAQYDFYYNLRYRQQEDLNYALSRVALGRIPLPIVRSISPKI